MTTALERMARGAWLAWGSYAKWTVCMACGEWRACRADRRKRFVCLECFDQEVAR